MLRFRQDTVSPSICRHRDICRQSIIEETLIAENGRKEFCIECGKETEYRMQKDIVKSIRDKEYTFVITVAVCAECGEEMSPPGLIDKNVQEIDEQYRTAERSC